MLEAFDMEGSDASILAGVSAAFLLLKRKRQRHKRIIWVKEYLKKRNVGILKELELNDGVLFKNFTRMSKENFEKLLGMVKPFIQKHDTRFRSAVPAEIRLAITLRYLATGDSFMSLFYLFKVSKQLTSDTLPTILEAIIASLKDFVKVSIIL